MKFFKRGGLSTIMPENTLGAFLLVFLIIALSYGFADAADIFKNEQDESALDTFNAFGFEVENLVANGLKFDNNEVLFSFPPDYALVGFNYDSDEVFLEKITVRSSRAGPTYIDESIKLSKPKSCHDNACLCLIKDAEDDQEVLGDCYEFGQKVIFSSAYGKTNYDKKYNKGSRITSQLIDLKNKNTLVGLNNAEFGYLIFEGEKLLGNGLYIEKFLLSDDKVSIYVGPLIFEEERRIKMESTFNPNALEEHKESLQLILPFVEEEYEFFFINPKKEIKFSEIEETNYLDLLESDLDSLLLDYLIISEQDRGLAETFRVRISRLVINYIQTLIALKDEAGSNIYDSRINKYVDKHLITFPQIVFDLATSQKLSSILNPERVKKLEEQNTLLKEQRQTLGLIDVADDLGTQSSQLKRKALLKIVDDPAIPDILRTDALVEVILLEQKAFTLGNDIETEGLASILKERIGKLKGEFSDGKIDENGFGYKERASLYEAEFLRIAGFGQTEYSEEDLLSDDVKKVNFALMKSFKSFEFFRENIDKNKLPEKDKEKLENDIEYFEDLYQKAYYSQGRVFYQDALKNINANEDNLLEVIAAVDDNEVLEETERLVEEAEISFDYVEDNTKRYFENIPTIEWSKKVKILQNALDKRFRGISLEPKPINTPNTEEDS